MVEFINLAASIVTVLGLYYIVYSLYKWINRPQFIIGILPSKEEQSKIKNIGRKSSFDEYHFNSEILARRINNEVQLSELRELPNSARKIILGKNGEITFSFVVQNTGKTEAQRYKLAIFFDNPEIELLDVHTETLEIDGFYSQNEKSISDKQLLKKLPDVSIREKNRELGLIGSYVSFIGSLATHTFEIFSLKIKIPPASKTFNAIFRIDCSEAYLKRAVYGQSIDILE